MLDLCVRGDLLDALPREGHMHGNLGRTHLMGRVSHDSLAVKARGLERSRGPLVAGLGLTQFVGDALGLQCRAWCLIAVWRSSPCCSREVRHAARNASGSVRASRHRTKDPSPTRKVPMPAPTKTQTIAAATADVLRRATVDCNRVTLPEGQLDRATYVDVNKVLTALGGKWNRSVGAHVFPEPVEGKLAAALGAGRTVVQNFGYFPTPPALVDRLLELAEVQPSHTVLEPSAGRGAIADRIACEHLILVEIQPANCAALRAAGHHPVEGDFLTVSLPAPFDRVVMNPPFERGQDIEHVTHAFSLLADGGRLVAVMSSGAMQRSDRKAAAFQTLFADANGYYEQNPAGSFKESGTNVNTITVVLERWP